MSVRVMSQVWNQSDLEPNHRYVLLAYADAANHDGTEIWPGREAIMRMTGYSLSTVNRITRELVEIGVLVRHDRGRRGKRASFSIPLSHPRLNVIHDDPEPESGFGYQDDTLSGTDRVLSETDRVSPVIRKGATSDTPPVLTRPTTPVLKKDPPIQKRDLLWEVFTEIHGEPATKSERGKYNQTVKILREAGVTPSEYPLLVRAFTTKHGGLQPAPTTISTRVGELRHFVVKGPVVGMDIETAERNARFARLEAEQAADADVIDIPRPMDRLDADIEEGTLEYMATEPWRETT